MILRTPRKVPTSRTPSALPALVSLFYCLERGDEDHRNCALSKRFLQLVLDALHPVISACAWKVALVGFWHQRTSLFDHTLCNCQVHVNHLCLAHILHGKYHTLTVFRLLIVITLYYIAKYLPYPYARWGAHEISRALLPNHMFLQAWKKMTSPVCRYCTEAKSTHITYIGPVRMRSVCAIFSSNVDLPTPDDQRSPGWLVAAEHE